MIRVVANARLGAFRHRLNSYTCSYRRSLFAGRQYAQRIATSDPPRPLKVHSLGPLNDVIVRDSTGLMLFNIPIGWGVLLGLRGRPKYLDSEIRGAVQDALAAPLEDGYSGNAATGRRELIEGAAEVLRGNGNVPPKDPFIQIPWDLLPGMLALLVEVGEFDLVLQVGARAAPSRQQWEFQRDVLLSMSLAQLGLARESLTDREQVARGCARMEEALRILSGAGDPPLAPSLRAEIETALASLSPYVTLDSLKARPTPEGQTARKEAVRVLRLLLDDPLRLASPHPPPPSLRVAPSDGPGGPAAVNEAFLRVVLQRLTSSEIVALLDWLPACRDPTSYPQSAWHYRGLEQAVARAHVAAGFSHRRPALIHRALELLRLCSGEVDVTTDRAACLVLLGRVGEAVEALTQAERRAASASGLASTSAPLEAAFAMRGVGAGGAAAQGPGAGFSSVSLPVSSYTDAMAFVRRNTPDPSDPLPGLCALTEAYLGAEVLPAFRDWAEEGGAAPDLNAYFDDPRVTNYLSVQDSGLPRPIRGLLEAAEDLASGAGRAAREAAGVASRLAGRITGGWGHLDRDGRRPPLSSGSAMSALLGGGERVEVPQLAPPGVAAAKVGAAALLAGAALLMVATHRGWKGPAVPVSPLAPLAAWGTSVTAGVGTLRAAAAEASRAARDNIRGFLSSPSPSAARPALPPAPVRMAGLEGGLATAGWAGRAEMTQAEAYKLVMRWQKIKGLALGPDHESDQLPTVLCDPMLSTWRDRSDEARRSGWFWKYILSDLRIESVDAGGYLGEGRGHVSIVARVEETADLWNPDGRPGDSYKSSYLVEYEAAWVGGTWKISGSRVLS